MNNESLPVNIEVATTIEPTTPVIETSVSPEPKAKKQKKQASKPKVKLAKCARIDELWAETGVVKGRADQILAIIKKEYRDCNEESTMRTIRCRPWHMRQAGKLPETKRGAKEVKTVAKKKKAKVETPAEVVSV